MSSKKATVNIPFDLVPGVFLQRLNRFMTLVEVNHEKVLAHLPNSGRLSTVVFPGATAYLKKHQSHLKRKSIFSLFAVERSGITIIVDAQLSNFLAKTVLSQDLFEVAAGYHVTKENLKVDGARLDFMLEKGSRHFFVEVKSVTHVIDGVALFPDAPTARGRKHVQHLIMLSKQGFDVGILFSVQRSDAEVLKPNFEFDLPFAELLREAVRNNLKIFTLKSVFTPPNTIELETNTPKFTF